MKVLTFCCIEFLDFFGRHSHTISRNGAVRVIDFCPFCGEKLCDEASPSHSKPIKLGEGIKLEEIPLTDQYLLASIPIKVLMEELKRKIDRVFRDDAK